MQIKANKLRHSLARGGVAKRRRGVEEGWESFATPINKLWQPIGCHNCVYKNEQLSIVVLLYLKVCLWVQASRAHFGGCSTCVYETTVAALPCNRL